MGNNELLRERWQHSRHPRFGRGKRYLPSILAAIVVLVFALYIRGHLDTYRRLFAFSILDIVALAGLALASIGCNGLVNYLLYPAVGASLTLNEAVGLGAMSTLANQLPFAGGMLTRGIYLKSQHKIAYSTFLSATVALFLHFIVVSGLVGVLTLVLLRIFTEDAIPRWLAFGFLAMAGGSVLYWVPFQVLPVPPRWKTRFTQALNGWKYLKRRKRLLINLTAVQLLMLVIFAVRLWIAFRILSQQITLTQSILLSAASILTQLVSITPGGLGVREAIVGGVGSILGFDPGIGLVASGIDRLVATPIVIAAGLIYSYVLGKRVAGLSGIGRS